MKPALIQGPQVYICDECVELCNDILHEEQSPCPPLASRQRASARRCPRRTSCAARLTSTHGGVHTVLLPAQHSFAWLTAAGISLGVASAVYLNEYAKRNAFALLCGWGSTILMQGVPSVVFGLFGLSHFLSSVLRVRREHPSGVQFSLRRVLDLPVIIGTVATFANVLDTTVRYRCPLSCTANHQPGGTACASPQHV